MTDGAGKTAVKLERVSFSYGDMLVLSEVSLTIDEGDFVSIVGPNGGGKTTLFRLLLGQVRPSEGNVRVFGSAPQTARDRIGYVPQYFRFDPSFPVTVRDVVLMGCPHRFRLMGHCSADDTRIIREALETVTLGGCESRPFAALSGGQRQRVLIARALASEPDLLLLDEPAANINPAAQDDLYDLLESLNQRMTILMVSHDIGVVSSLVRRVVCVNRSVWVHPTSEFTGEALARVYGSDITMIRHDHRCADGAHGAGESR